LTHYSAKKNPYTHKVPLVADEQVAKLAGHLTQFPEIEEKPTAHVEKLGFKSHETPLVPQA